MVLRPLFLGFRVVNPLIPLHGTEPDPGWFPSQVQCLDAFWDRRALHQKALELDPRRKIQPISAGRMWVADGYCRKPPAQVLQFFPKI